MQTEEIRAARRRSETERKMVRWKKKRRQWQRRRVGSKWVACRKREVENSPIIEGDITKKVRKSTRGGERDRNCEKKL